MNPAYIMDIVHRKGYDRIIAITDAMFATNAQDIREFEVAGIKGRTSDSGEYLQVVGRGNTLFGSMLTMSTAFGNWVSWLTREVRGIWFDEHLPLEIDEAVFVASQLCSTNPAKVLNMLDPVSRSLGQKLEEYVGTLVVGKRADVALLRLDGEDGNYRAEVTSVF